MQRKIIKFLELGLSALGMSLVIVKPPVVAAGAGLLQGEKLLIAGSVLGMLAIAIISAWLRRKAKQQDKPEQ